MDRRKYLGFVVFPAAIAGLLAFLFFVAKVDIFRARTMEQSLKELHHTTDPLVRAKAAGDLRKRGDATALPGLRDALAKEPSGSVRCNMLLAIASLEPASATADIAPRLADEDADVRRYAAFLLGELRDPASREPLRKAVADPAEVVRWNAAVALARLGDASGIPTLHDMLRAPTPRSLKGAVETLVPGAPVAVAEPDRAVHANALLGLALVGGPESVRPIEAFIAAEIEPDLDPLARETLKKIQAKGTN
jgi:HEAT repeat protein